MTALVNAEEVKGMLGNVDAHVALAVTEVADHQIPLVAGSAHEGKDALVVKVRIVGVHVHQVVELAAHERLGIRQGKNLPVLLAQPCSLGIDMP